MSNQLTLQFEPGLLDRYTSLRECMTGCIYQRGLKRVAMDLDKSPGNLSRQLSGDSGQHFSIESLEDYLRSQGDLTPLYYLIARFMQSEDDVEAARVNQIRDMLGEITALVGQSGLGNKPAARRR